MHFDTVSPWYYDSDIIRAEATEPRLVKGCQRAIIVGDQ